MDKTSGAQPSKSPRTTSQNNNAGGNSAQPVQTEGSKRHSNLVQNTQQSYQGPSNVGQYVLSKTIGKGTFGKVKLGVHNLTGENVAVKILEKEKIQDVNDVERVAREIHILKMIRHPNIIQLYEIIETPKQLYLIMEYAQGGEVFDYIVANHRVKEPEAATFFHQIISGVEYLHKLSVVHRDLKPENLLLTKDKMIKIVDFGLSNTYKPGETLKTACGSPCYAAPEMIAGKRYHGSQVDIWSSGVILYALVAGYLPFEDPNTNNLYKKILSGEFKIPSFLSSDAKDLISKILNTDPSQRYTISDIRKHPWYNQVQHKKITGGIFIGLSQIPINTKILDLLCRKKKNDETDDEEVVLDTSYLPQNFDYKKDYVVRCLNANKHNHITTSYYLLLKKYTQLGDKANPQIKQEDFRYFDDRAVMRLVQEQKREELAEQERNAALLNNDQPKLTDEPPLLVDVTVERQNAERQVSSRQGNQSQGSQLASTGARKDRKMRESKRSSHQIQNISQNYGTSDPSIAGGSKHNQSEARGAPESSVAASSAIAKNNPINYRTGSSAAAPAESADNEQETIKQRRTPHQRQGSSAATKAHEVSAQSGKDGKKEHAFVSQSYEGPVTGASVTGEKRKLTGTEGKDVHRSVNFGINQPSQSQYRASNFTKEQKSANGLGSHPSSSSKSNQQYQVTVSQGNTSVNANSNKIMNSTGPVAPKKTTDDPINTPAPALTRPSEVQTVDEERKKQMDTGGMDALEVRQASMVSNDQGVAKKQIEQRLGVPNLLSTTKDKKNSTSASPAKVKDTKRDEYTSVDRHDMSASLGGKSSRQRTGAQKTPGQTDRTPDKVPSRRAADSENAPASSVMEDTINSSDATKQKAAVQAKTSRGTIPYGEKDPLADSMGIPGKEGVPHTSRRVVSGIPNRGANMMRTMQEPLSNYDGLRGINEAAQLDMKRASLKQPTVRAASIETASNIGQNRFGMTQAVGGLKLDPGMTQINEGNLTSREGGRERGAAGGAGNHHVHGGGSVGPATGSQNYGSSSVHPRIGQGSNQMQQMNAAKQRKGPYARFDQVVEKVRFQVNVRDNSVSSNEGTQAFNALGSILPSGSKPFGGDQAPSSFGNTSNLDNRVYFEDDTSQERGSLPIDQQNRIDKLKAGFNVSYDSNSFQGIKNNLIQQTKVGQNMNFNDTAQLDSSLFQEVQDAVNGRGSGAPGFKVDSMIHNRHNARVNKHQNAAARVNLHGTANLTGIGHHSMNQTQNVRGISTNERRIQGLTGVTPGPGQNAGHLTDRDDRSARAEAQAFATQLLGEKVGARRGRDPNGQGLQSANIYTASTRQNIKSIIQTLNDAPLNPQQQQLESSMLQQATSQQQRRPVTQLLQNNPILGSAGGQKQAGQTASGAQGVTPTRTSANSTNPAQRGTVQQVPPSATNAGRQTVGPSGSSVDQQRKYLSSQKQKQIPLMPGTTNAVPNTAGGTGGQSTGSKERRIRPRELSASSHGLPRLYKGPFNLACSTARYSPSQIQDKIFQAARKFESENMTGLVVQRKHTDELSQGGQQPWLYSCSFEEDPEMKFDLEIVQLQVRRQNRQRRQTSTANTNPQRPIYVLQFYNKSATQTQPQLSARQGATAQQQAQVMMQKEQQLQERFRTASSKLLRLIEL